MQVKHFQVYTSYVNLYQSSIDTLKRVKERSKAFVAFLQSCQSLPGVDRKDLTDLLIAPIQQIPRYVLLLRGTQSFCERYFLCSQSLSVICG